MTEQDLTVPVIAIDGGAGTGKGTARAIIAQRLSFNSLDSGVLYRALGLVCYRRGVTLVEDMISEAEELDLVFEGERILLDGNDETLMLRSDEAGALASKISAITEVRAALLDFQLRMRVGRGLVADGRDQCTIFDTPYRYFFVCDPEIRARRRVLQFEAAGQPADYDTILAEIIRRDEADQTRSVMPLVPHPEALIIDTGALTPFEMAQRVIYDYRGDE